MYIKKQLKEINIFPAVNEKALAEPYIPGFCAATGKVFPASKMIIYLLGINRG